ncbi:MAG: hypothetical protein VW868_02355 [Bacteroidota bacterium]
MKSQAIGELKQTTINRIRLVIGTPNYADDVRKQCYYFISELVAAAGPQPFPTLVKRATIYKGAKACGFEDKVIYRWMLHPEFKSNQRGFYNLSVIFDSLDPENDEVPGPWKTKIPGKKPAAKKPAKAKAKAKKTRVPKAVKELPSRSEQRAAMRDIENEVSVDEQLESNMVMNNHSVDYEEYDHNDFGIEDAVMADV